MAIEPIIGEEIPAPSEQPRRRRPPGVPGPADLVSLDPAPVSDAPRPMTTREEDPRTRAARRAADLREHMGSLDQGTDDFYIDLRTIPPGWSYEWKRHTTVGAEDPAYQVQLARGGWEAVPVSRHPEMMPEGYRGMTILRKGMLLMERPLEITEEAKDIERRKARGQVQQKEAQLNGAQGPGQFARDNKGNSLVNVKKTYEAIPIPKE